ncbi:MAG: lamin tail domain-containing protein [Chitinophagales bacterium]|nr:lamin tail domain-containing protein [Chitinophagales bacterium]
MKHFLLLSCVACSFIIHAQDCAQIFISEYVEGTGNNKALEIYNPSNAPVNLADYELIRFNNGETAIQPVYTLDLIGTVAPKKVIVYVKDTAEGMVWNDFKKRADYFLGQSCAPNSTNRTFCFNGNDALIIRHKTTKVVVDGFGYIGDDPGNPSAGGGWNDVPPKYGVADSTEGKAWTTNHTLIRKYNVKKGIIPPNKQLGQPAWNVALEWDSFKVNTYDSLRFHRCVCNEVSDIQNVEFAEFDFYPNPASGIVQITSPEDVAEVIITHINGQYIQNRKLFQRNPVINVKELQLSAGFYLLHVRTASNKTAAKLLQIAY